jgi:ribosome-associated heat shock protein Hsp15
MRAIITAVRKEKDASERHRLDKWLWCTRFYKSRSLAGEAVAGGRVHLNGERIKPAHNVHIGDRLEISVHGGTTELQVLVLPDRRGAAGAAAACYAETALSRQRRERLREQQRLAHLATPRPDSRPDKRDRRKLQKLQRGQN